METFTQTDSRTPAIRKPVFRTPAMAGFVGYGVPSVTNGVTRLDAPEIQARMGIAQQYLDR